MSQRWTRDESGRLVKHSTSEEPEAVKASKNKRIKVVLEDDEYSDISMDEEVFDAFLQFLNSLKVRKFANNKVTETQETYKSEIQQRENAKLIIKPAKNLHNENIQNDVRKQYLWSHFMPSDILKLIFMDSIFNPDIYDPTVLNLVLICKNWRMTILDNEKDEKFQMKLWYPLLNPLANNCDWKHLALIPDKYLKLIRNIRPREMTVDENVEYRKLIHDYEDNYTISSDDILTRDSNIPLLIAIIQKCPNIYSIDVMGELCVDLFFEIGDKCKNLGCMEFSFTSNADSRWFDHCMHEDSEVIKTLESIHIERSYWIDDEAFSYFGRCESLRSISTEKPAVSSNGILSVFEGCTKLISISIWRGWYLNEEDELLSEAFKALSENNKEIRYIDFDDCMAFNDECLDYLMKKDCCPELVRLNVNYCSCTQRKIRQFKKKRPSVKTDIHTEDMD